MNKLVKNILRKAGLIRPMRKIWYYSRNFKYIARFAFKHFFALNWQGQQVKFLVRDPFSANFFSIYFKNGKLYEEYLLQAIRNEISDKSIFVDVGANIGYFTCLIARLQAGVKVIAFEMGKQNFEILNNNVQLNLLSNVQTENYAVSDTSGFESCVKSEVGAAALQVLSNKNSIGIDKGDIAAIEAISLDEYFSVNVSAQRKIFKIDVEGAEGKVLSGMKRLLNENCVLFIEVHKKLLPNYGHNLEDIDRILEENSFEYKLIGNENNGNPVWYAKKRNS